MYDVSMDVSVSALRSELARWIERVRAGEEVVVTDRGVPVARLSPVDTATRIEQLVQDGILSRPEVASRPLASGIERVPASEPVSPLVAEQRRSRGL